MALRAVTKELSKRKPICSPIRYLVTPLSNPNYSTDSGGDGFQPTRVRIFYRELKLAQRDRGKKDQLLDSVAENLLDRLQDCKRNFTTSLSLGGSGEAIRRLLKGRGESMKEWTWLLDFWIIVTPCK